ncbi:MAG TPA: ClpX C4-type zinc finger protein [Kofleriaceae bacterium]|nr:ClpX C4-type zinc finger protein [Kofleriaceae bacterium]
MSELEQRCPVCAGDLTGGDLILVCSGCHRMLGNVEVRATGEFMAATPAALAAAAGDHAKPATGSTVCAWCGRHQHEVKKLLTSAAVAICNECVALCADILTAELGDDWT